MSYDFIKEIKDSISTNIPSSSIITRQVLKKIHDRSSNANEIVEIIQYDPPLTARILRIANSTYSRAASKINSLERAVVTRFRDDKRNSIYNGCFKLLYRGKNTKWFRYQRAVVSFGGHSKSKQDYCWKIGIWTIGCCIHCRSSTWFWEIHSYFRLSTKLQQSH